MATYNICGCRSSAPALSNLRKINADVIFLQETSIREPGVKLLSRALGMNYVFGEYRRGVRGGMAILSRGALKLIRVFTMPGERNFAVAAELTLRGRRIVVVCLHLKSLPRPIVKGYFESMGIRAEQAGQVVALVRGHRDPVIVAGDCNTLPISPEYLALASELTDCCVMKRTTSQPTIFVDKIGYRIDHIFVAGPWTVRSCNVAAMTGSDHRPVVAELELPPHRRASVATTRVTK